MRGNGERIGPQNLPTSSIAGGIWNLLNQQRAQQRGAWPSATPAVTTDPYFMYVPLLLNTTSTNGQQNNTFLDSSTNNFTITRNGTPTQGAFTPYQPSGYWSGLFNGSSDYLSTASNAALIIGTSSATVEFWVYPTAVDSFRRIVTSTTGTFNTGSFVMRFNNGTFLAGSGGNSITSSTVPAINTWSHVAWVGTSGTSQTLYINGVSVGTAGSYNLTEAIRFFGGYFGSTEFYSGYLANLRIVNGTAIVPPVGGPTAPLTAVTNTSLLTLQSNRFIDNSSNAFAITVNGTPKVQAFQPFSPSPTYSTTTYGGSGYFLAASSQYLTGTITAPSSSIVVFECWVYNNSIDNTNGNHYLQVGVNNLFLSHDGSGIARWTQRNDAGSTAYFNITSASGVVKTNQWQYWVGIRSGSNAALYIDGARVGSATGIAAATTTQTALYIGTNAASGSPRYADGYISNARIVSGTLPSGYDPTQTTIAVPTTPLTAVTGTLVLTNYTNAGIYDAAWQNNALTVGDAQASTTQKQWGTTSMKFDGTGDYLRFVDAPVFDLGSSDFTIEAWVYTASSIGQVIYSKETPALNGILFQVASGLTLGANLATGSSTYALILTGGTITASTWTYVAITRVGSGTNNIKLFLGTTPGGSATQVAQGTFSGSIYTSSGHVPIVGARNTNGDLPFNGYIQDFRFTKGVGRTITTVPTAAFPTR